MIAIYEPLYLPGQTLSDKALRPLEIEGNSPEWREFRIIVDMYRRGLHREQRFTGVLSPKFGIKTGLSGQQFIEFVRANSDADVCFVNPFAYLAYISFNVWMQGEIYHPGLTKRAQALLDASGIDLEIAKIERHGPAVLCYCNFWAGTERFWDDYVGGLLLPIAEFLETHPESAVSRFVHESTSGPETVPFLPYIIERLFSSYLSRPGSTTVYRGYPTDAIRSCLNDIERKMVSNIRNEIDVADLTAGFSRPLRAKMRSLCMSWKGLTDDYYVDQHHPHKNLPPTRSVG